MNTKTCTNCKQDQPIENFQINCVSTDNHAWVCKTCMAKQFQQNKVKTTEVRKKQRQRDYQKHRSQRIQQAVEYRKRRIANDPQYRVAKNLRGRLRSALKGALKNDKTFNLIGCTPYELYQYLESKFTEGMTWDNYGIDGWCVDHIVPCSAFDLNDSTEQKQCFHYTNLQPMWFKDNLSKSDKWIV